MAISMFLGQKYLPTAWEIGYNHCAGRLGLHMPETAALLQGNWPEYYEFMWGVGTLTHADSASQLWRSGITTQTMWGQGNDRLVQINLPDEHKDAEPVMFSKQQLHPQ